MTYVIAGLVLVGAVAGLNLIFTLGVIRRLREHTEQLALVRASGGIPEEPDIILEPGQRPSDFAATTVDGIEVTRSSLQGTVLVGFFSPHCSPCKDWIPRFAEAAGAHPGQALAVIAAGGSQPGESDAAAEVASLRDVAHVVVEPNEGPVQQAFSVRGWPAMCRLGPDGTVSTTANHEVAGVPVTT